MKPSDLLCSSLPLARSRESIVLRWIISHGDSFKTIYSEDNIFQQRTGKPKKLLDNVISPDFLDKLYEFYFKDILDS